MKENGFKKIVNCIKEEEKIEFLAENAPEIVDLYLVQRTIGMREIVQKKENLVEKNSLVEENSGDLGDPCIRRTIPKTDSAIWAFQKLLQRAKHA